MTLCVIDDRLPITLLVGGIDCQPKTVLRHTLEECLA